MVMVPWLYHGSSALSTPPQCLRGILLNNCANCLQINHKKCKFLDDQDMVDNRQIKSSCVRPVS